MLYSAAVYSDWRMLFKQIIRMFHYKEILWCKLKYHSLYGFSCALWSVELCITGKLYRGARIFRFHEFGSTTLLYKRKKSPCMIDFSFVTVYMSVSCRKKLKFEFYRLFSFKLSNLVKNQKDFTLQVLPLWYLYTNGCTFQTKPPFYNEKWWIWEQLSLCHMRLSSCVCVIKPHF